MLLKTIAITLLVFLCSAEQLVPINAAGYGINYGDTESKFQITFFMDLLCIDSKTSFDQWTDVQRSIDLVNERVKLTVQFMPLQFHFYAFKMHVALFYILKNAGDKAAYEYISHVMENQDNYSQQTWMNKTLDQFLDALSTQMSNKFKLSIKELRSQLNSGTISDSTARNHFKYSVGSGVSGAPVFHLNGVLIDGGQTFSAAQWIEFISKYNAKSLQDIEKQPLKLRISNLLSK